MPNGAQKILKLLILCAACCDRFPAGARSADAAIECWGEHSNNALMDR